MNTADIAMKINLERLLQAWHDGYPTPLLHSIIGALAANEADPFAALSTVNRTEPRIVPELNSVQSGRVSSIHPHHGLPHEQSSLISQIQESVGIVQKQLLDHNDSKGAQIVQWIMDLDPNAAFMHHGLERWRQRRAEIMNHNLCAEVSLGDTAPCALNPEDDDGSAHTD